MSLLHKNRTEILLEDIRKVILYILCTDHHDEDWAHKNEVEKRWFNELKHLLFNSSRYSRGSALSRSTTPTPTPMGRSIARSSALPSPYSDTLSTSRNVAASTSLEHQSAPSANAEDVVDSIEFASGGAANKASVFIPESASRNTFNRASYPEPGPIVVGETNEEDEYEVEAILGQRVVEREGHPIIQYLVKWVGWPLESDAWEDSENLANAADVVRDFNMRRAKDNSLPPSAAATHDVDGNEPCTPSPKPERRRSRFASSYSNSNPHTRSPSAPPLTPRSTLAINTMKGDISYELLPQQHEDNVVRLVRKPLAYKVSAGSEVTGWVYAIQDPELELVKIGFTTVKSLPPGHDRYKKILEGCSMPLNAYIIKDVTQRPIPAFRRLEDLVHEDLRPHRKYFDCACGHRRGSGLYDTEHHEWYKIPPEDAVKTIDVWRSFLLQEPYGVLQNNATHYLQDSWECRLRNRALVSEDETHQDHEQRILRWQALFTPSPIDHDDSKSIEMPPAINDKEVKIKLEEEVGTPVSQLYSVPFATDTRFDAYWKSGTPGPRFELNGEHFSIPATPALSLGSVARSTSADASGTRQPIVSTDTAPQETPQISEQTHGPLTPPAETSHTTAKGSGLEHVSTQDFALDFSGMANLWRTLDRFLQKERSGLSPRTAYHDIYYLRWPITSAAILALYSPYAPPFLTALVWLIFLPLFVAELREW